MTERPLWHCPKCGARLISRNLWHSCGRFTLEALFAGSAPGILAVARKYVALLESLGDVQVLPQKTRLVAVARVRFAGLYPRKGHFIAGFALHRWLTNRRIVKTVDYGPRWRGHYVRITSAPDLNDELRAWLQESHDVVGLQSDLAEQRVGRAKSRRATIEAARIPNLNPQGQAHDWRPSGVEPRKRGYLRSRYSNRRTAKIGAGRRRVDISRATEIDLDGIMELQTANQPERGGTLSASLPRSRIAKMMRAMPLIVARCSGRITGFLMTSTREMNADVPIIGAMLAAYPGATDAYVYGPICVSAEERGKGLAQAMFAELERLLPGREGILFIRRDNPASLRAHAKMGMHEVAGFVFDGNDYVALSYVGPPKSSRRTES